MSNTTSVSGKTTVVGKIPFSSNTAVAGEISLTYEVTVAVHGMTIPGENVAEGNTVVHETPFTIKTIVGVGPVMLKSLHKLSGPVHSFSTGRMCGLASKK